LPAKSAGFFDQKRHFGRYELNKVILSPAATGGYFNEI